MKPSNQKHRRVFGNLQNQQKKREFTGNNVGPISLLRVGIYALVCLISGTVVGLGMFGAAPANATAGINQEMSFQGKIVSSTGQNIPDGTYNMEFRIYTGCTNEPTSSTGCTPVWTEDYLKNNTQGVTFTSGTYQVNLGSICAFTTSTCESNSNTAVNWNSYPLYLSLQIGNTSNCSVNNPGSAAFTADCGGDGVMNPFVLMTSTPYALNANAVGGFTASQLGQLASNNTWTGTNAIQATSTTALTVQNTGGTNTYLNVDTSNNRILVGNGASNVIGETLTIKSAGTGYGWIDTNGTQSLGTYLGSNYASLGTYSNSELDFFTNNSAYAAEAISTNGSTTFKDYTDNSAAFQIQNATGKNLLNIDTSGGNVNLGIGAPPTALGYTTVGGSTGSGYQNTINANKFTATQTGTVTSMSAYIPSPGSGFHYQMALYTDNAGVPGTYIASTASAALATGWNTANLTTTPTLTAGTTYWLAYWTDVTNGTNAGEAYDSSVTGARYNFSSTTYGSGASNGMPTSWPGGSTTDVGIQVSIYASFSSSAPAVNVNSAGNLSATGAATFIDSSNSTSAFQVQNASGSSVLSVDTLNKRVGVNQSTPGAALDVVSAATGDVGIQVTGKSGQTANLLQVQDGTGTPQVIVNANGSLFAEYKPTSTGSSGSLELGSLSTQSANAVNGTIGFWGLGVANAQIAYSVGDGFYLCNSSASDAGGNYGQCASRVNLYAQNANFNGTALFKNSSTTGFQVQDAGGVKVLTADTSGDVVDVGSTASLIHPAQLYVQNTNAANRVMILQGASGQSADLLDMYNGGGQFVSGYDVNGNEFINGYLQSGTTSAAGTIQLKDGTANNRNLTITSQGLTNSYTMYMPAVGATGNQCLQSTGGSTTTSTTLQFGSCGTGGSAPNTPITLVNSTPWESDSSSSVSSGTLSDAPTHVGDLVVLSIVPEATSTSVSSVSGGGVTSWTKINASTSTSTADPVELWMGQVTSTGSGTVTVNFSGTVSGGYEIEGQEFTVSSVTSATSWGVINSGVDRVTTNTNTLAYPTLNSDSQSYEAYVGYGWVGNTSAAGSTTGFTYHVTGRSNLLAWDTSLAASTGYSPTGSQPTAGPTNSVAAIISASNGSGGSGSYINNSTTTQSGNLNVQAAASGTVAGVLEANAGGTGDVLDLLNGSGVTVGSVSSTGNLLVKPSTDSTTALSVQNHDGSVTVLNVDTTNKQVAINSAGIPLILNVTSATNENGILFKSNGTPAGEIGISGGFGQIINQSAANDLNLKSTSGNIYLAAGGSTEEVKIDTNGNTTFKNAADSTTNSFQIQNAGSINLFSTNTTNKLVNVGATGADALATTVNVGTSTGAAQVVHIGDTSGETSTVTIGSTSSTSATTIQGGTGGTAIALTTGTNGSVAVTANGTGYVGLYTNSATSGTLDRTLTNSTVGFQVQNSSSKGVFTVDTANTALVWGSDGTTSNVTLRGGAATGSNSSGSDLTFQASNGTGAGGSGSFKFQTAAPSSGGIGVDNNGTTYTFTTSQTLSYTTGSQSNRFMLVTATEAAGTTVSSITYNGVNLTKITSLSSPTANGGGAHIEMWGLIAPASGTHNVVATLSSADGAIGVTTYYNVDQTTPYGTAATASGSSSGAGSSSLSTTTTSAGQVVADGVVVDKGSPYIGTPGSGQTQQWLVQDSSGIYSSASSTKAGTGSAVTTTWGLSNTVDWAAIGIPINPVSNSTADTMSNSFVVTNSGTTITGNSSNTITPSFNVLQSNTGDATMSLQNASGSSTAFYISDDASNSNALTINSNTSATYTGSPTSIGYSSGTATDSNGNMIEGSKFTATVTGNIESMTVDLYSWNTSSDKFSVAVYADSGGIPGTLLGYSGLQNITLPNGSGNHNVNTINLSTFAPVTSGTNYWLVFNTDNINDGFWGASTGGPSSCWYSNAITNGTWTSNPSSAGAATAGCTENVTASITPSGSLTDTNLNALFTLSQSGQMMLRNVSNSTTAFQIQNSSSTNLFSADTTNGRIIIGTGSTGEATPDLLVLDSGTTSSDPTEVNGAMYYNSSMGLFRCGQGGVWRNCVSSVHSWAFSQSSTGTLVATSTSTYYTYPGSGTLSFTKAASGTNLVVHIDVNPYASSTGLITNLYVDVDSAATPVQCGQITFNVATTHLDGSCTVILTGISSGSHSAKIEVTNSNTTTTLTTSGGWQDMSIQETD